MDSTLEPATSASPCRYRMIKPAWPQLGGPGWPIGVQAERCRQVPHRRRPHAGLRTSLRYGLVAAEGNLLQLVVLLELGLLVLHGVVLHVGECAMTSEGCHRTQGLGAWGAPAIMTGCRCETLLQVQAQRAILTSRNLKLGGLRKDSATSETRCWYRWAKCIHVEIFVNQYAKANAEPGQLGYTRGAEHVQLDLCQVHLRCSVPGTWIAARSPSRDILAP